MERDNAPNRYDDVPYPTGAFGQTHPGRLATLATLFGMKPAPIETCRVLELGCGSGGNIFPMAVTMPQATFVGIDYSAREIEEGLPWIERLGLRNISLRHENILDFKIEPSSFDYIIAHGVFSWVPHPVQEKILEICGSALAENGVAYVSYNAYPGCYIRKIARDLMAFQARDVREPSERIAKGRAALAFAATAVPPTNPIYAAILKGEAERNAKMSDEVVFHDDLSEMNEPFYFHRFIERASIHGLKFLSEALFADMQGQVFPAHAREALEREPDIIAREQYRDFLSCRSFRQTLLCKADVGPTRQISSANVRGLYVSSNCAPTSPTPEVAGASVERFKNPEGVIVGMNEPFFKAALVHLAAVAPRALSIEALADAAVRLAKPALTSEQGAPIRAGDDEVEALRDMVASIFSGNMVELHVSPPGVAAEVGARPRAFRLARLQAAIGAPITTITHKNVDMNDTFARALLERLDGTRDIDALAREIAALGVEGSIELFSGGERVTTIDEAERVVRDLLAAALPRMLRYGLLEATDAQSRDAQSSVS